MPFWSLPRLRRIWECLIRRLAIKWNRAEVKATEAKRLEFQAAVDRHLKSPQISAREYQKARQIITAEALNGRTLIYLDTMFWVLLRKVMTQEVTDAASRKFFHLLCELVEAERVVCPTSDVLYYELLKQSDFCTRESMARVMDALSCGVAVLDEQTRINTEVYLAVMTVSGVKCRYTLDDLVWAAPYPVLDKGLPNPDIFKDPLVGLAYQKAHIETSWDTPLVDLIGKPTSIVPPIGAEWDRIAANLRIQEDLHDDEVTVFKKTAAGEVVSAVDLYLDVAETAFFDAERELRGFNEPLSESQRDETRRELRGLITQGASTEKGRLLFPTLYIGGMCHAAIRWDESRVISGNDLFDIKHIAIALRHCNAFFTEKDWRTRIMAGHMKLDTIYNCRVIAKVDEAISYLETLAN